MRITAIAAAIVVLLIGATPSSAQSADPYFSTASANYDFVYHEPDTTSSSGAHFDAATTIKRDVPFLGLIGEAGFNHFEGATVSDFMGGVRVRFPNAGVRVLPFAQLLGGLYHCGICSINDFAIQGGGGVDVKLAATDAIRVRAQIDFRHVFDSFEGFSPVRVTAGVVLPLNR